MSQFESRLIKNYFFKSYKQILENFERQLFDEITLEGFQDFSSRDLKVTPETQE